MGGRPWGGRPFMLNGWRQPLMPEAKPLGLRARPMREAVRELHTGRRIALVGPGGTTDWVSAAHACGVTCRKIEHPVVDA